MGSDLAPFEHVMIDIETLSLHPTNAVVLSAAVVEFDPAPREKPVFGEARRWLLDVHPQLAIGRQVDAGTQKFWADQPPGAKEQWAGKDVKDGPSLVVRSDLHTVLMGIKAMVANKSRVWSQGPQFDQTNLCELNKQCYHNPTELWHYRSPRDSRTFLNETLETRPLPDDYDATIPGQLHDPIYDCIRQIWLVWSHWQM